MKSGGGVQPSRCALLVLLIPWVCACGYRPVRSAHGATTGWCVESSPEPAAHPHAVAALAFGAEDALARREQLADCSDGRLVVRVLDVRFEPVGVVAQGTHPWARATRVLVVAKGSTGSEAQHALGEVTGQFVVATGSTALSEQHALESGVVSAAREAGELLVRRLLGEPAPGSDP